MTQATRRLGRLFALALVATLGACCLHPCFVPHCHGGGHYHHCR